MKELLARCTELRNGVVAVKPRYFLQVVVYGSRPRLWTNEVVDIERALTKFVDDDQGFGLGGSMGATDAEAALRLAHDVLQKALAGRDFAKSFPPMLFHLTDGESQTDALEISRKIRKLRTADGNVLLVNAYIGAQTALEYQGEKDFPGYLSEQEVGDVEFSRRLFEMSSVAPDAIVDNLRDDRVFPRFRDGSRLFFDVRTQDMLKHVIQVVGSIGTRKMRQRSI